MSAEQDRRFMQIALQLAERGLGQSWPNPSVGALIVRDGRIVAQGITAPGGRPHAETQALAVADKRARGATLYVTLEPCSHHGQTPPCSEAIIAAGIARVVVACADPNPQVNGNGVAPLRRAGIEVVEEVLRQEAEAVNRGFFSLLQKKRPFIALKLATSLDGKIAAAGGESQWITGERARAYGHYLRSRYDAIATGIGTVLADNPALTCRLPGLEHRSPQRIVFDRQGRLPETAQVMPAWPMNAPIGDAVTQLAERGITRLLIEAGTGLSTAFLQSGLVDRIYWFRAPFVIGNTGMPALGEGFAGELKQLPALAADRA